jgi:hypothetical protein
MGIVDDLVTEASGSSVPVASLLRRVKVIAARSKTKDLADWVDHELSGYPQGSSVPSYRGPFRPQVLGHLSGPFGSGYNNAPIPPMAFPEEYRGGLFEVTFLQPVAELESLSRKDSNLRIEWPADALMLTQYLSDRGELKLDPRLVLNQAYQVVSPNMLAGIVDTVRSRILDLALSLEDIAPTVGEEGSKAVSAEKMTNIFHTHIHGSGSNVALGSSNFQQYSSPQTHGDENGLLKRLAELGLEDGDLAGLRTALQNDRDSNGGVDPNEPGAEVQTWWARWSLKTASAAGKIGVGAAGGLAAKAIAAYFGMG